jgi:hypothetical protein
MEQYAAFLEILPVVEQVLKDKGQSVPRPAYDGISESVSEDVEAHEEGKEKAVSEDDGNEE